eukprot:3320482-Pleurochrysis_carterae.AAC.2
MLPAAITTELDEVDEARSSTGVDARSSTGVDAHTLRRGRGDTDTVTDPRWPGHADQTSAHEAQQLRRRLRMRNPRSQDAWEELQSACPCTLD